MRNPRVLVVMIYGILAVILLFVLPTRYWILYLIGGAMITGILWSQVGPPGGRVTSPNPERAARRARRRSRRGG
jgi:hypothetical protein